LNSASLLLFPCFGWWCKVVIICVGWWEISRTSSWTQLGGG
jgi:hypothetical protein